HRHFGRLNLGRVLGHPRQFHHSPLELTAVVQQQAYPQGEGSAPHKSTEHQGETETLHTIGRVATSSVRKVVGGGYISLFFSPAPGGQSQSPSRVRFGKIEGLPGGVLPSRATERVRPEARSLFICPPGRACDTG